VSRATATLHAWLGLAALGVAVPPASAAEAPVVLLADEPPFFASSGREALAPPRSGVHAGRHHGEARHGHRPYHPAPGVVVDVLDGSGAVAAELQRAARDLGYWPFRRCYEEGLRRNQELSGTVSFDLMVLPEGAVRRTERTSASLGDEVVAACVAREAHHLALPPLALPTIARVRVLLATGDEPVPGPFPVPRAEELRAALRSSWPAASQCLEVGLARHPDVGGRMELRFEVGTNGAVVRVAEGETRFADGEVTQCVVDAYRSAHLPATSELRGKAFVYPLHLEPGSRVIAAEL
jgi:hypothetical protein